jgi:hypothetical protein
MTALLIIDIKLRHGSNTSKRSNHPFAPALWSIIDATKTNPTTRSSLSNCCVRVIFHQGHPRSTTNPEKTKRSPRSFTHKSWPRIGKSASKKTPGSQQIMAKIHRAMIKPNGNGR